MDTFSWRIQKYQVKFSLDFFPLGNSAIDLPCSLLNFFNHLHILKLAFLINTIWIVYLCMCVCVHSAQCFIVWMYQYSWSILLLSDGHSGCALIIVYVYSGEQVPFPLNKALLPCPPVHCWFTGISHSLPSGTAFQVVAQKHRIK